MKVNALILALAIASVSTLGFFAYVMMSQPEPVKPTATAITTPEELPLTRENLLKLVNEERAKVGVAPLVIDERLNQSAQMKADDMALYNYFSHTNHDGSHGPDFIFATASDICASGGENYTGMPDKSSLSANEAMTWWIKSEPHYKAMINPTLTLTGFGLHNNLAVQHFCKPH